MAITLALIGATVWFILIFVILIFKQRPEAQLRKRLNEMIDQAEEARRKSPKQRKNASSLEVEVSDGVPKVKRRIPFYGRVVVPLLNLLDDNLQKFAPNAIRAELEEKIFRVGKLGAWSITRLVTYWCLSIGVCTLSAIALVQYSTTINPMQKMMVIVLGVTIGSAIPFAVLNSKIRKRKTLMRKQLPEFMDILCVSVQAGLSFDGAVSKMIKRMKGPLIDEFRRMQHDVALGMTHQYALTNLAKRCDLEEIYLFTTSIIQAEKLGTSMTRTLQVQADNMRDRHRQWVKSEALKAPVKILFPMILFIFPSMFVVLLFPAIYSLIQNLGNK